MGNLSLFRQQGGVCWLCGRGMELAEATRDHIIPRSKGGRDHLSNIRLAHAKCNSIRGSLPAEISADYVKAKLAKRPYRVPLDHRPAPTNKSGRRASPKAAGLAAPVASVSLPNTLAAYYRFRKPQWVT